MSSVRVSRRRPNQPRSNQNGFVLIAMCACMFLLMAVIGLAFDLGRVYIARNEAQIFVDAASMAAAQQIDGTASGLARARAAVHRLPNRWNMGTETFHNVQIEFAADAERGKEQQWEEKPSDTTAVRFVRVTAPDNQMGILFLRAVGAPESFTVPAHAVAATNPVRLAE